MGFPDGSDGKESSWNVGDPGLKFGRLDVIDAFQVMMAFLGYNPIISWERSVSILYIMRFNLLTFCKDFCVYSHKGLWSFFFFFSCDVFLVSGLFWPHKVNFDMFLPLIFWDNFERWYYFFLKHFIEFTGKDIRNWSFLYGKFFIVDLFFSIK